MKNSHAIKTALAIASVAWMCACATAPQPEFKADVTVVLHATSTNEWDVLVSTASDDPRRIALADEQELRASLRAIAANFPYTDTRPPLCTARVVVFADASCPFEPARHAILKLARAGYFRIAIGAPGQAPRDVTLPFDHDGRELLPQLAYVEIGSRSPANSVLYRFSDDAECFYDIFIPEPSEDARTTPKSTLVEGIEALRDLLRVWREKAVANPGLPIECRIDPRGACMQEVLDVVDAFRAAGFEQLEFELPQSPVPSLFQTVRR